MYYTYLIIIRHPRLGKLYYAGYHKVTDSPYMGSCKYRYYKMWLHDHPEWFQKRILSLYSSDSEAREAESSLILKCLKKHGAFLYGTSSSAQTPRAWLDPFGQGSCLNGHWGKGCNSPELHSKVAKSKISNGTQLTDQLFTESARSKANAHYTNRTQARKSWCRIYTIIQPSGVIVSGDSSYLASQLGMVRTTLTTIILKHVNKKPISKGALKGSVMLE